MKIEPDKYGQMRGWFACVWPMAVEGIPIPPGGDPIVQLDRTAARAPAQARTGLAMVIGTVFELTANWPAERVAEADRRLASEGLPTYSDVQRLFSRQIQRIVQLGHIANEREYHAIRNAVEASGAVEKQLWKMLAAVEEIASAKAAQRRDRPPANAPS